MSLKLAEYEVRFSMLVRGIRLRKGFAMFAVFLLFSALLWPAVVLSKTLRGDDPQCQEECLREHSQKMGKLSEEYAKTGNKMKYQDEVDREVLNYSRCVTNCREVLPVK